MFSGMINAEQKERDFRENKLCSRFAVIDNTERLPVQSHLGQPETPGARMPRFSLTSTVGGFCWGMMEEGDLYCHRLNEQLGFAVFSLDYPLLPEAVYPQALEWLYESILLLSRSLSRFYGGGGAGTGKWHPLAPGRDPNDDRKHRIGFRQFSHF